MSPHSRRSFLLGAGTNWLAFAATLAVGFLLTPYLIRALGKPRYDVWCVAESVLAYFTLLDMGVAACLTRSAARRHATADADGLNRVASACLAVFLAAGGVALLVGVPVLAAVAPRLDAKADEDVLPFLLLMLANLSATLPLSVFPAVLDGLERFAAKSLARLAFLAARTAGIVAVVNAGGGLLPVAAVMTAANLLEHAVLAGLCFRFLPGLRLSRHLVDRATLREVRGYSGDAFLAMLAGRVTVQTGAIVVGLYLPAGSVTYFATAARLVEYAKTLLRTITATLTPGVSAMEARGDHAGVRRLFLAATRWVLYLVVPVNLGLWFFGGPFLHRWVGPEFVAGSYPATAVLALTLTIGVAQSVASRILYGLGRLRWFARLALVEAGLNLGLTLLLVGPFGVEGVAVAVAVPNLVFCAAVIAFTARDLGATAGEYASACAKPLVIGILPAAVWFAVGDAAPTWAAIGAGIAAGLVPYAVVVMVAEFGRELLGRIRGARNAISVPILEVDVPPRRPGRRASTGADAMRLTPLALLVLAGTADRAAAQMAFFPPPNRSVTTVTRSTTSGGLFRPGFSATQQTRVVTSSPGFGYVAPRPPVVSFQTGVVTAGYSPGNGGFGGVPYGAGLAGSPYGAGLPVNPGFGQQVGYGPQGGFGPGVGPEVNLIQQMYAQYLGRQPDPQGLQTWVVRYNQLGGDTNRLTQEFAAAAQRELNANNPYFPR